MKRLIILAVVIFLPVFWSCNMQEPEPADATLNELMRERTNDLKLVKEALQNDEEIPDISTFREFVEGLPSRDQLKTDEFQAQLSAFDEMYAYILNEKPVKEQYQAVLTACVSCHQQYCPGPLRVIRNLEFEPTDDADLRFY